MEKINVAALLEDCPEGMELDCTMYESCTLNQVCSRDKYEPYPIHIKTKNGYILSLTKYGQYRNAEDAKCLIFPKGKTNWEGFQRPFFDGDIVATVDGSWIGITEGGEREYAAPTYCVLRSNGKFEAYTQIKSKWSFDRLATEGEKERLFKAIKDNNYKWNPNTKTLEKLDEPKFKDGDILTSRAGSIFILEEFHESNSSYGCYVALDFEEDFIKNSEKFCNKKGCRLATEEEKKKLFAAIKAKGYYWNHKIKILEKLSMPKFKAGDIIKNEDGYKVKITGVNMEDELYEYESVIAKGIGGICFNEQNDWKLLPNKFDFTTLKPFDRVLVRDCDGYHWGLQLFATFEKGDYYPFHCLGNYGYKQCIPYKGNEHLLRTTNDCSEYYKIEEQ